MRNLIAKWEINLTTWHTVPRFNPWLFTVSVKLEAPFRHHPDIMNPVADNSVPGFLFDEQM